MRKESLQVNIRDIKFDGSTRPAQRSNRLLNARLTAVPKLAVLVHLNRVSMDLSAFAPANWGRFLPESVYGIHSEDSMSATTGGLGGRYGNLEHCGKEPVARDQALRKWWLSVFKIPQKSVNALLI